jgi:Ca2+/H+ antiporter
MCFSSDVQPCIRSIAVGSSIQIAAGMIPLLVLVSWAMGKELTVRLSRLALWASSLLMLYAVTALFLQL